MDVGPTQEWGRGRGKGGEGGGGVGLGDPGYYRYLTLQRHHQNDSSVTLSVPWGLSVTSLTELFTFTSLTSY